MSSFTFDTLEWPAFIKVIPWVQHLKLQRTFYSVALLLLLKSSSWLESWPDLTWILRSYEIRFVPKETNRTSQMSNKNTSKMQSKNLSKSVKYWSFTLLIMHYLFVCFCSLCFSLSTQTSAFLICARWLFVCRFDTNLSGGRAFSAERPHWLISFWLTQLSTYVWVAGVLYDPGFNMAEEEEEDDDNDDDNQEKYMNVITTYISFIFLDVDCYCHSSLSSSPSSSSLLFKARVV